MAIHICLHKTERKARSFTVDGQSIEITGSFLNIRDGSGRIVFSAATERVIYVGRTDRSQMLETTP